MNGISDFLNRLLSGVFKLLLVMAAAVFVFSLLLATVVVVAGVSIWSLLTGRKPTPAVVFGRFRQTSDRVTRGVWPNRQRPEGPGRPVGDVVDVQAHEVPDDGQADPLDPAAGPTGSPGRDRS